MSSNYSTWSSSTTTTKPRFGRRFQSWGIADEEPLEPNNPWSYSYTSSSSPPPKPADIPRDHICRPVIIGSDGKAIPAAIFQCPPKHHRNPGGAAATSIDKYKSAPPRAQEFVSAVQSEASEGGRRAAFPGGMFRRGRFAEAAEEEETPSANGGWGRRSGGGGYGYGYGYGNGYGYGYGGGNGQLGRVTNDVGAAASYLRESAPSLAQARKKEEVIDSRAAVKKYGGSFFL